ncbi:hypothetical protein Y1Q_0020142 [Alligator mississippiensis]|uniref:Uncharacterized protein n=1 Tax=Alligator mississippiensis TaxID=8496 RepID=A0A151LZ83_ALLMI|nr:hypothetical protein Y1Q_0020142 [Alligator mississippiensis]
MAAGILFRHPSRKLHRVEQIPSGFNTGTQDIYTGAIKKECMDYIILDHTEQESLCFEIPQSIFLLLIYIFKK